MPLLTASAQADVHLTLLALVVGLVVGVLGHITNIRWLIVLGIAMIGLASALFSFVLRPGA